MLKKPKSDFERRKRRTRFHIKRKSSLPRLCVYRSNQHIYAQVIDDERGVTVASASTLDKELRAKLTKVTKGDAAAQVGAAVAKVALKAGVGAVVFDRGGYMYHGRIAKLADAAREQGLKF